MSCKVVLKGYLRKFFGNLDVLVIAVFSIQACENPVEEYIFSIMGRSEILVLFLNYLFLNLCFKFTLLGATTNSMLSISIIILHFLSF